MKHSKLDVYFLSGGLGILNRCGNPAQSPALMSLTSDLQAPEPWSIATHANRETQPYFTDTNKITDTQAEEVKWRCWNVLQTERFLEANTWTNMNNLRCTRVIPCQLLRLPFGHHLQISLFCYVVQYDQISQIRRDVHISRLHSQLENQF